MAMITDPDNIVLARKGALHEKLTNFFRQLQGEVRNGTLDTEKFTSFEPSFLAANLLQSVLHSGDARISDTSLTR